MQMPAPTLDVLFKMRNFRTLVLIFCVYGKSGHAPLTKHVPLETKDSLPRTTSVRIPGTLRDVLNQESLVRFSMVQKIQELAMDVIEIKKHNQMLKSSLNNVMDDLETLKTNDRSLQGEDKLKQHLKDLCCTIRDNKCFAKDSQNFNVSDIRAMQRQISLLQNITDQLTMENDSLREKLELFEKMDMKLQKNCIVINQTNFNLLQENSDFKRQLNEMNETLNQIRNTDDLNSRLKAVENGIQQLKLSTDASLKDIREDLNASTMQLQNISAEIRSGK
jgi:FtsZ-binding cell division protein ZapB